MRIVFASDLYVLSQQGMTSHKKMRFNTPCETVANFKYLLIILILRSHVYEENAEEIKLKESLLPLILKSLCLLVCCHKI
jgi:hypothetical protein